MSNDSISNDSTSNDSMSNDSTSNDSTSNDSMSNDSMSNDSTGNAITNGREPRSCLGQVFNFKLGSFTDNNKIVQHANGHFKVENSAQVLSF